MSQENENNSLCDFGQYDEKWKNHKKSCKIIIRITDKYIVYIDMQNNLDWETIDGCNSESSENKSEYEKVLSQCLIAEHKPTFGLSDASILGFKVIVGEAIVNCLENNCDGSLEILKQADDFRLDRVVEKSREWYLGYTMAISAVLIVAVLFVNACCLSVSEQFVQKINIGAWAIAGVCLSIIMRSGRLQNASYAGKRLHLIESGSRVVGGFISGQIVYLGVKSGVLFASLVGGDNAQYIISFLALLAGASERFAPSIITKIEESTSLTEANKGG